MKHRHQEPEAGIDGIVLGGGAGLREPVRDEPFPRQAGRRFENVPRLREMTGRQQQAGQRDQRVPAPDIKPGIARDETSLH